LTPSEDVTFFHSTLLLYNCKYHHIKDEQLDIVTSLILLMLTILPSLRLISYKQTVSSNQCLCCSTGLKLSWPKGSRQNSKTWVQVTRRRQSS